jgi:hypothetical protein
MFGHRMVNGILQARKSFLETWIKYCTVIAGDREPSLLHYMLQELLVQVSIQYTVLHYSPSRKVEVAPPAVPMDSKRMRDVLKQAIAMEKARQGDESPDSDIDADYD